MTPRGIGWRMKRKIMVNIDDLKYGFEKGKVTKNTNSVLKLMIERAIEMHKSLYRCYINFQNAFEMMEHIKLVDILEDIGLDGKCIRVIRNL